MKLTPEQIEKELERCEEFVLKTLGVVTPDFYAGWLAAIESQPKREIRLPKPFVEFNAEDEPSYYFKPTQLKTHFESQGFTAL